MFGFSLLLLIETSRKQTLIKPVRTRTRPSREHGSATLAFLSPRFALLSRRRGSRRGSAFQESSQAALPSPFTEMHAAESSIALMHGCWLLFSTAHSFSPPPFTPLNNFCAQQHISCFSSPNHNWAPALLHSQHYALRMYRLRSHVLYTSKCFQIPASFTGVHLAN